MINSVKYLDSAKAQLLENCLEQQWVIGWVAWISAQGNQTGSLWAQLRVIDYNWVTVWVQQTAIRWEHGMEQSWATSWEQRLGRQLESQRVSHWAWLSVICWDAWRLRRESQMGSAWERAMGLD